MTLEDFADSFNPLELSDGMVVVEVEMKRDNDCRKFYIPVQGATGVMAMIGACNFIVEAAAQEYLLEHNDEYVDVDSNYVVFLHDDEDNEVPVHSEGELLDVFIGGLIKGLKLIEGRGYAEGKAH